MRIWVHTGRVRVLLVDDHAGFRSRARALLELDGFEVVAEAAVGSAAVAAARTVRPEVVLLDVRLPDVCGFALVDALRETGASVVLISTRSAADYGDRVARSAAVGFIAKAELCGERIRALVDGAP